jgi:hypothetical protein
VKLGLENKRNVVVLSVLGLGALYGVYSNFSDSSPGSSAVPPAGAVAPPSIGSPAADSDQPAPRARRRNEEWHPVVHSKNKDEQVPTDKIDPALHLDLLAKVMDSKPAGGARNLFEFSAAKFNTGPLSALKGPDPIIKGPRPMGPPVLPPPPGPAAAPPPPPMPPLNAQYYGFASPSQSNRRRGFFMMPPERAAGGAADEQNILIKSEGEILTGHYKIVKLEAGSVTVEDTDSKRTKTLAIVADASD